MNDRNRCGSCSGHSKSVGSVAKVVVLVSIVFAFIVAAFIVTVPRCSSLSPVVVGTVAVVCMSAGLSKGCFSTPGAGACVAL